MLAKGKRFDLVVNLDGFNEVAFGAENAERGVDPSYPRNWSLFPGDREALDDLAALGRAAVWSRLRRSLAARFDGPVLAHSGTRLPGAACRGGCPTYSRGRFPQPNRCIQIYSCRGL